MGAILKYILLGIIFMYIFRRIFGRFGFSQMNENSNRTDTNGYKESGKNSKRKSRINTEKIEEIDFEEIED